MKTNSQHCHCHPSYTFCGLLILRDLCLTGQTKLVIQDQLKFLVSKSLNFSFECLIASLINGTLRFQSLKQIRYRENLQRALS